MRSRFFRTLPGSRSGAAALEFAIVAIPFFGLVLGMMSVAINLYLQVALDFALQQAVRQVQLGLVPATMTAADFTAKVFCPVFVVFAPCSGLLISVQPVADFTASTITATGPSPSFCVGAPGQLIYARAVYQAPLLETIYTGAVVTPAGPGTGGSSIVSAAAFANENPSGTSFAAGSGC